MIWNSFEELMIYNRGPRQDPCGTPQSRERLSERVPEIETRYILAIKYEVNQYKGAPEIPNEV